MKTRLIIIIIFTFLAEFLYAGIAITNGLTHYNSGKSGDIISCEVILLNTSETNERVTFEINDILYSCSLDKRYSNKDSHDFSSNNWFGASTMEKILSPKETFVYKFTISIPKDAKLKGTYWSALIVNVDKPIKENTLENGMGFNSKVRYAIRLFTNVNADSEDLNIDFEDISLIENNNILKNELGVKIINQSLFIEPVKLTLEVYDTKGIKIYESSTLRKVIVPSSCREYSIDISKLPQGAYHGVLIASAREEFIGANISMNIK